MPWLIDHAKLIASELVTNAIKVSWIHCHPTVTVWLWANGSDLLIEVWDASPEAPVPLAEPQGESDQGLAAVAALSESWGYYPDCRRGKVVWAYLGWCDVTGGNIGPAAGYSGAPLHRKLGIKPGHAVAVVGAPPGFAAGLAALSSADLTEGLPGTGPLDVIVTFVRWRAELETQLPVLRSRMAPACGLWIAWPKRAAKVPTDMTEHVVREVALPTGLVDNKVCAIDQVWSGLRLVIRRELR